MALNPLSYTEKVVRSFLRYQLTTYPFADQRLNSQMRELLSLDHTRETPLLRGPYISLSRAFEAGAPVEELVREGVLHEHMHQLIPFPSVYGHQENAIRSIVGGKTTLVSTGTGSGKSECFLYPIISRCLQLRDEGAPAGICAVIVYPMNALAEDQLGRLRELLAGTGISFGMYVGKTPTSAADVYGYQLEPGASNADYVAKLAETREAGEGSTVHPAEEVCSREAMRTPGGQPRILLTNAKQLELLLTRQSDIELFDDARLDFLVFDEAHTFTGAQGAEVACLIRRLRSFCGREADQTVCVATSATIVDTNNPDAAREFASRFFGSDQAAIELVSELHEKEEWAGSRAIPDAPADAAAFLERARGAVDAEEPGTAVADVYKEFTNVGLDPSDWQQSLHGALSANELLWQCAELLQQPRSLASLLGELVKAAGRDVTEEELIAWLTLGAAAQHDGRPLVRPVVHGFLRGVQGAVVTFEPGSGEAVLHLSAEEDDNPEERRLRLGVFTCATCGQHYYEHALSDFEYMGPRPGGGQARDGNICWESMGVANGGIRALFMDKLISSEEAIEDDHPRLSPLHLCRACGAAHETATDRCLECGEQAGTVELQAVQQREDREGVLTTCVCCGTSGRTFSGRFREPIKPVRAANVKDVHVLSQDMIHHAERERLLVFADNRQDAAFQAGWMKDHARRFGLRAIIAEEIQAAPISVGDLVHKLDRLFDADDALSFSLLPEVWNMASKEAAGSEHQQERKKLLRIVVLRELTVGPRQQVGLEPLGRLKVNYLGLEESALFIQKWARKLGLPADELTGGIGAMLDQVRRGRIVLDRLDHIYSRTWAPGDRDLENGYVPEMQGVPRGLKLTRDGNDHKQRVMQWHSPGHQTTASQIAAKWGVDSNETEDFLKELWDYLCDPDIGLLAPATLVGSKGRALPQCAGTHQLDADRFLIAGNLSGVFRCGKCRRRSVRRTPLDKCIAWRCDGELEHVREDDNYDLNLIDQKYSILRPEEHTAMVPSKKRERIEQLFKGDSDAINALVCTQTLELGVDIGSLDSVLMRNVPPLPANYWQRAGRAGRRHRMAVNLTYCRPVSHDRAYFAEPLKLLAGQVDPPSFNLSNELMVRKHVHATIITRLNQLAREGSGLSDSDREEVQEALLAAFPQFVRDYLFSEEGALRSRPLDVSRLRTVITKHQARIEDAVRSAFEQGWPEVDSTVTSPQNLSAYVSEMTESLEGVIDRLFKRLRWAMSQIKRLDQMREEFGDLGAEQESFFDRCRRYVRRLKSNSFRQRNQSEGVDDVLTYSVLAAEGFLPGYGLDVGSVKGMAEVPYSAGGGGDFDLPRAPSVALREYVPGNLIYANGQKFVPRRFARNVEEGQQDSLLFEVNPEREAIQIAPSGAVADPSSAIIQSIPVGDVILWHQSRISDEEDNRFQMGVAIYGREEGPHSGGYAYLWNEKALLLRKSLKLQLVNVGAPAVINRRNGEYGYPVCTACGQSVSPFSSQAQRDNFIEKHEEWCGKNPESIGFFANLSVDALTIRNCDDREEAYSVLEGIRFAAAEVLDMALEDLQVLVVGRMDTDEVDAILYDPMPGGSGLLEQIVGRFPEVAAEARRLAEECPSFCDSSCIDCFHRYRNAFYHKHLNRHVITAKLDDWGDSLVLEHEIPAKQPQAEPERDERPVNLAEQRLKLMLERAGFSEGSWQTQVVLGDRTLGSTTPDVTYVDPDEIDQFIYIYLDGLSGHIHGNPETRNKDTQIRNDLIAAGHYLLIITAHDLGDKRMMSRHFKKLARMLKGREAMNRVEEEAGDWFVDE